MDKLKLHKTQAAKNIFALQLTFNPGLALATFRTTRFLQRLKCRYLRTSGEVRLTIESTETSDGLASYPGEKEEDAILMVTLMNTLRDRHRVTSNATSLPSRLFICVSA